jgi:hypothetical protein
LAENVLTVKEVEGKIEMVFHVYETHFSEAPPALLEALGVTSIYNTVYNEELKILLLEIAEPKVLTELKPDFAALYQSHDHINGVLVTAASGTDGYDFIRDIFGLGAAQMKIPLRVEHIPS